MLFRSGLIAVCMVYYFGFLTEHKDESGQAMSTGHVAFNVLVILLASILGILGSYGVAWFGIRINTVSNSRAAFSALKGNPFATLCIPLRSGMSVGLLLVAFPAAHGIVMSALYLPVIAMLVGLMLRGVSFEFRLKAEGWQATVTNEQAYVEGTEAKWWTMVSPKRRQEIALGGLAAGIAVGALVVFRAVRGARIEIGRAHV